MERKGHHFQAKPYAEKVESVQGMEFGGNNDLQKVFDLILKVAVDGGLKNEQMIKRVFVFSDMEFDNERGELRTPHRRKWNEETSSWSWESDDESNEEEKDDWETDYQVIERKFREKAKRVRDGDGNSVLELRHSRATPVPARQKGVALVSGFSKNMVKLFLNYDGIVSPVHVMEAAISGEEYQKVVVLD